MTNTEKQKYQTGITTARNGKGCNISAYKLATLLDYFPYTHTGLQSTILQKKPVFSGKSILPGTSGASALMVSNMSDLLVYSHVWRSTGPSLLITSP